MVVVKNVQCKSAQKCVDEYLKGLEDIFSSRNVVKPINLLVVKILANMALS